MPDVIAIGELRWPVTIARRVQVPNADTNGIVETLVPIAERRARVTAVKDTTYLDGAQLDTPFTHRIAFRWVDYDFAGLDFFTASETFLKKASILSFNVEKAEVVLLLPWS